MTELPRGWRDDKLSDHVGKVHGNTLFIFDERKPAWSKLREIDDVFLGLLDGPPRGIPPYFLFMAHSAFRAGVVLATGGHVVETYPVLRAALENALYAAFVGNNEERFRLWFSRNDDEECLRKMKEEFKISAVIADLRSKSPKIAEMAQALYDRTINFGAHPNPLALLGRISPDDAQEGPIRLGYLVEKDSEKLWAAVKTTCQVGTCVLDIAEALFPERFKISLLSDSLARARRGL